MAIRIQDLSGLTRAELLALTDRDLPSINDLPPRLTSWSRKKL